MSNPEELGPQLPLDTRFTQFLYAERGEFVFDDANDFWLHIASDSEALQPSDQGYQGMLNTHGHTVGLVEADRKVMLAFLFARGALLKKGVEDTPLHIVQSDNIEDFRVTKDESGVVFSAPKAAMWWLAETLGDGLALHTKSGGGESSTTAIDHAEAVYARQFNVKDGEMIAFYPYQPVDRTEIVPPIQITLTLSPPPKFELVS